MKKHLLFIALVTLLFSNISLKAGDGTEGNPYTIAEAIALPTGATEYWAQGIIVGGAYNNFNSPWTSDYAISLSDNPSETDVNNCLQVKLESDGGRTTWGLASNPTNKDKVIKFKGFRDAYGGYPSFEGVNVEDISEVVGDTPPEATFDPADGEEYVAIDKTITITFDEKIYQSDGTTEIVDGDLSTLITFKETDAAGADVPATMTYSNADPFVITIDPTSNLSNGQDYYVAFGSVYDDAAQENTGENATFTTIPTNYIILTDPVGGEKYYAGDSPTVTWNHANVTTVDIKLYIPSLDTWELLADDAPSDGTEGVTIPSDAEYSNQYKLAVVDISDPTVADTSDVFTVVSTPTVNAIQSENDGDASNYEGHIIKTSGIVTATDDGNYFIQDGNGEWNGIQVIDGTNTPTLGDNITIEATVEENYDLTRLNSITDYTVNSSGNTLPTASVITTGTLGESYEGVLVKIVDAEVTNPDASYGQYEINDGSGALLTDDDIFAYSPVANDDLTITGLGHYSYSERKLLARDMNDIVSATDTVGSSVYDVNQGTLIISDIPPTTILATFETNFTAADSATFDVYDTDETTPATVLDETKKLIVTAADGITKTIYTLDFQDTDNDITSFIFEEFTPDVTGTIDDVAHTVTLVVPYGTDTTSIVPTIEVSANATISPLSGVEQNFSSDVEYTVTAEDGTPQVWTVTVNVVKNTENDITSFTFADLDPAVIGVVDASAHKVTATVPYDTDVIALVPTIEVSPDATISPLSGVAQNFTDTVDYTVTSEDLTDQVWKVIVVEASSDAKNITSFSFESLSVVGVINEADSTITLEVPYGTNVTALVATFGTTGAEVKVGADTQVSGTTENNFTSPVVYTVVAADLTERIYTVTVNITAPATDATLDTLTVDNGTLVPAFDAATENYTVELPYGTTTEPVVSATANDANANVDITQATDVEGDLAARTATVVVTAEDGTTTKTYTVVFSIAPNNDATLSDLTVDDVTVEGFDAATYEYNVELPFGTTDEPVVAATATDANANVDITQATDVEGDLAARTATVVVTAEDGTTELTYTIIFTIGAEKDLFFSEYIEGSSSNKALEIYNPTDNVKYLNNYLLKGTGNEATEWEYDYPFNAGDSILPGDVFVIVDDGAIQDMLDVADWVTSGYECGFNGNDARGLFKIEGSDTTLIDILGTYDNASGAYFDAAGVTGALTDHTLIRKDGRTSGITDWTTSAGTDADNSEWIVLNQDSITDLGKYGPFTGTDILTYSFVEQTGPATINDVAHTVNIEVAFETSVDALVATFTLSEGASAKVGATDQVSGTTANNFTSPVTYTITAEDESTQDWIVTVTVAATQSDAKEITSFTVEGIIGDAVIENDSVKATVEYGTDITSLKPTFTVSDLATITDTTAARNFTNPQEYTVTAEDLSTKVWTVVIDVEQPTDVSDIASLRALYSETNTNLYRITGEVTLTYATDPRFYIQDGTAAILIYNGNDAITSTYDIGDNIQNLVGTFSTYAENMQFQLVEDPGNAVSTGNTITAQTVTIPELAGNYDNYDAELIKLEDVTFTETGDFEAGENYTLNSGSDQVALRTNFSDADYIGTAIPTETLDVTAIAGIYYGTVQVYPRSLSDIVVVTGIDNEFVLNSVKLYPNPSNGLFKIELNNTNNEEFFVEVYDIIGKMVYKTRISENVTDIDLTEMNAGIYYVSINNGDNRKVSKIMIQ